MGGLLHPKTTIGPVALIVASLDRQVSYYTERLGFRVHRRQGVTAYLGAGGPDLLILSELPGAIRRPGTTGLYHFAILLPTRAALARALQRLLETGEPLQGTADHLVSESIYLADPEGNGIEIYSDRPKESWKYDGAQVRMPTEALDMDGLLQELTKGADLWRGLPPRTRVGHIHLKISDLAAAEAFYRDALGFDLTMRYKGTAAFLAAGGYHHHVAINTWAGVGIPAPPDGSIGLREFVLTLPDAAELNRVVSRISRSGVRMEETPAGVLARDPSQNVIRLVSAASEEEK
jgi:catechol 2,3-dioxygenase